MTVVTPSSLRLLAPEMRAQLVYQQARGIAAEQLWQATLGTSDAGDGSRPAMGTTNDIDIAGFLTLLDSAAKVGTPQMLLSPPTPPLPKDVLQDDGEKRDRPHASTGEAHGGDGYHDMLIGAAERTGVPANALAAIIDAEAAKGSDGRWLTLSRNGRSSAAGLGQFLSGTWKDEAERPGTWLHQYANANGWLNDHGKVRGNAKSDLLALRYDPRASIEAVADYALTNLTRLRQAGITIGATSDSIARAAYFAHHLGVADAIDFLGGKMDPQRAGKLLAAQIGTDAAARRIQDSGDAVAAHRGWLLHFVSAHVRPDRFATLLPA